MTLQEVDPANTIKFAQDPLKFIKNNWVEPYNYAPIHQVAVFENWAKEPYVKGQQHVIADPDPKKTITLKDLYILQHFCQNDLTPNSIYCALATRRNDTNPYETVYSTSQDVPSAFPVYFLPSRGCQITSLTLPEQGPDIMLTTAVDSCSLFVTCDNPSKPLNSSNKVTFYHANGFGINNIDQSVEYTRELLKCFTTVNGQHLALELTQKHYWGSDIEDEKRRKNAQKDRSVTKCEKNPNIIIVIGTRKDGIWSFHYLAHIDIAYDRSGLAKKIKGDKFDGTKHRLLEMHAPNKSDWGEKIP